MLVLDGPGDENGYHRQVLASLKLRLRNDHKLPNINVCSLPQPQQHTFKVRLGISRTNADSQWNPVYNAFHRFLGCGNETIRR